MPEQPPIPPKQSTGITFNFDAFRAKAEQVGYAGLSIPEQRLVDQMASGIIGSPERMAEFLIEEETRLREQNSPKAQAELAEAEAKLEATKAEARSKANESAAARARITSALETINKLEPNLDNLVGPLAPAAQMKDKWINPEIYAQRFDLANTTKNDVLEAAKYVKPLSNDERKFLEDMFPKIDDPAPVWRNYFDRTRRMLGAGLGESAPASQSTPAQPAAPAPQPAERIIRGQRWILNPQTGKYYVAPGQ